MSHLSVIRIDDCDDPRIAAYRDVRERDLVGRERRFVAEGQVVLGVLARTQRFRVESVLIDDKRLPALADVLAPLAPTTPVYIAASAIMDAITGFHIHRGILAMGQRHADPEPAELIAGLGPFALVAVLIGVANHDNVGGIFRNAAAFGVDAVLLDASSCDPLYRKALRVSVGGSLVVPFARGGSGMAILDSLEAQGFTSLALSPAGKTDIRHMARQPRTALLLGAEGPGLPDALMARAHTVRIAMAEGFDSLNVATASGIALHALAG